MIRSIPVVLGELEETFDEEGRPTGFAVLTIDSSLHGPTEVVGLSLSNATSSQHLKVSFSSTAPGVKTCIPFLAHEIDRALFGPVCVTVEQLESDSG